MTKPTIQINVVSDVICPWCYIGKRRVEKAIAILSEKFNFEIEYLPYELNPQTPKGGVDHKGYLVNKFGGEERYNQITQQVTAVAATEGLVFDFEKQSKSPNTRDAHRLIQWAKDSNVDLPLVEALFRAYFVEGRDLSSTETLTSVAVEVGMDRAQVEAFLTSNTGEVEIEMTEQEVHRTGITGVPFYIINNKYGISGAQATENFIKAFEEIGAPLVLSDDASCDVDTGIC